MEKEDIHRGRVLVGLVQIEGIHLFGEDTGSEAVLVQFLLRGVIGEQRDHRGNRVVADADVEGGSALDLALIVIMPSCSHLVESNLLQTDNHILDGSKRSNRAHLTSFSLNIKGPIHQVDHHGSLNAHASTIALLHAVNVLMEHLNALHFAREVQPGELHVVAHVQRASEHRARHHTAFAGDGEEMVIDEVQRS